MSTKTAIVTTYRGAADILDSFLSYHLALGFDHIFLFSDDPEDPGTEIARRHPAVTVVPTDDDLRARWRRTPLYRSRRRWIEKYLYREVMARQMLNVEVAVGMAVERGVDWLLHIDVDELFYSPAATVAEHFREMTEKGFAAVRYMNLEAAPEKADVVDCFREVTLFKVPSHFHPGRTFSQEQRKVMQSIPNCPARLFNYYEIGKSAARVTPGLRPDGVHDFFPEVEHPRLYHVQRWLGERNPFRWLRRRGLAPRLRKLLLREGAAPIAVRATPAILHYPCCTFDVFWQKYRARGRFADRWFGKYDIRAVLGSTHLDSRDVVQQGDPELARKFFRERFVLRKEDA
ncbi:MAG TPA: glycosyltransferase family 2 protein, partial [Longimicrobiaceae bacterium]